MLPLVPKLFGLAGTSIVILAIVISALCYQGKRGERYSLLNHFISELGEVGVSPAAWVFNRGLTLGGLLLVPFMIGLGIAFHSVLGWIGMLAGLVAAVGVAAVGQYPMNNLTPHIRAAMTYFRAGLVMVIFFALAIFFQSTRVLPPAANLLSLVAALCYGSFLLLLDRPHKKDAPADGGEPGNGEHRTSDILDPEAMPERPRLWWTALLEWLVFFSTVAWIFGVAALG
jgi:hypothetical membrane protein